MLVEMPRIDRRFNRFTPRVRLKQSPLDGLCPHIAYDELMLGHAKMLERTRAEAVGITGNYTESFFNNKVDFSTLASFTAEASLLGGPNVQPFIPAAYFLSPGFAGRGISILARGVLSTTSTPTFTFQVRLGATAGASYLSGSSLGVSAAITTASGVSNKLWELRLDLICTVGAIGTGNATLSGAGTVTSPGGFASPFIYPLEPTTPDTATWTTTFDAALTQFVNLSVACSASSSSNNITLKQLVVSAVG